MSNYEIGQSVTLDWAPKASVRNKYKCWFMDDPDNVTFCEDPGEFMNNADRKVNKCRSYVIARNDAPSDW